MNNTVAVSRATLIGALMSTLLLLSLEGIAATCRDSEYWEDRTGYKPIVKDTDDPSAGYLGDALLCYLDSSDGHFRIYFNECEGAVCNDEQIREQDAESIGKFLECVWQLFLNPSMSNEHLVFTDPRPSIFLEEPVDPSSGDEGYVPVWIYMHSGAGGGGIEPRLSFPANGRLRNPVTPNALHEVGHILTHGYAYWPTKYLDFAKEGLPTFFETAFRQRESRYRADDCYDRNAFLDLSRESLRTKDYCPAARFWHFVSMFGRLRNVPEFYERNEIGPECEFYSDSLDQSLYPTGSWPGPMRRIPGRDIIKAFYERIRDCFPDYTSTPVCTEKGGFSAKCAYAPVGTIGEQDACQPNNQSLRDAGVGDEDIKEARGLPMMPLFLDAVDYAALNTWPESAPADPRSYDGIDHFMFRRFLEWNYKQPQEPGGTLPTDSIDSDTEGFRIHAFGAHYHQFDISTNSAWLTLRKEDDLAEWAYAAFYVDDRPAGRVLVPVSNLTGPTYSITSSWRKDDFDEIYIPAHEDFEKAVVIVTAFGGEFDPATVSETGHYQLRRSQWRIQWPSVPRFWLPRPLPWPYGPFAWGYGSAPLPPGVRPWPWYILDTYRAFDRYGGGSPYRNFTPTRTDGVGWADYSAFGRGGGYRYGWPTSRVRGDEDGYTGYGIGSPYGYDPPWRHSSPRMR